MTINIFANDWLLMVACNIVPFDSISIVIVEHSHARLGLSMKLNLLPVVGLSPWWSESSSRGPVLESGAISGWHGNLVG
jgi:hypothetical protein